MNVWTIQIARWRLAKTRGIAFLDTTVKSAKEYAFLAPSWEMVMGYKQGSISENQYTELYYELLRSRYKADKQPFLKLLDDFRDKDIAVACFCTPGHFCHRHLLVTILRALTVNANIPFEYKGELNLGEPVHE
ncbi:hypothetical protein AH06_185 [Erwinia phage AH06]|nr:hypothetical protein AH06_185 [Erwinia phage AH06]